MRRLAAVVVLVLSMGLVVLNTSNTARADDSVTFRTVGNVMGVWIYKDASTGAYLFTRLIVAQAAPVPADYYVVNCDGHYLDDRANCLYQTAFLQSASCVPLQHTSYPAEYVPQPIDRMATIDTYSCKTGASRKAGECVGLNGLNQVLFTQSTLNQVTFPWLVNIDWLSQVECSYK